MDDEAFDAALVAAGMQMAAEQGWRRVTVAAAATSAGLPLARARARFPSRCSVLMRLGRLADQAALGEVASGGSVRDTLFDLLMRRIDAFQAHRAGVLAVLQALPAEPETGLLLALATRRSMRWMLDAAGVPTAGLRGELRVKGLVAIWLWTMRAWRGDETADLSATMSALDTALQRAEQAAEWLGRSRRAASEPPPNPDAAPEVSMESPGEMPPDA